MGRYMAKTGRPRKIKSPQEMEDKIDAYVKHCEESKEPITYTGMAMWLGLYGRNELNNYENYEGYSSAVKRARKLVENAYEKRLHTTNPTGAIFALKNLGWSDKQEHSVSSTVNVISSEPMDLDEWREKHSLAAPARPPNSTH